MDINDLKQGEIYYHNDGNMWISRYIGLYNKNRVKEGGSLSTNNFFEEKYDHCWGDANSFLKNIRIATKKEKHWLNVCIKNNKFIEFKEAMKTFRKNYEIYY